MLILTVSAAFSALVAWLYFKNRSSEKREKLLTVTNGSLRDELARTRMRIETLAKYETVLDLEGFVVERRIEAERMVEEARVRAQRVIDEARRNSEALLLDAKRIQAEAESRATTLLASARRAAEEESTAKRFEAQRTSERLQGEAASTLASAKATSAERVQSAEKLHAEARAKSSEIIEEANRRAQEIAGDAYLAMQNARQFEETARAMQNVIEGYGRRYLVPTFAVLDELGEELGFTEAGKRLKEARERVREMIKGDEAATCDYVEPNRRETAIQFIVDAFNGKCDTVLSDVRHDNYGTLEQKIKDAFNIVNNLGRAFRNARIEPAYLKARLNELRWGVAAHELKQREREEQRAIKERIREEEVSQREFEKAMKEAAKEESTIRKAMEKARSEIENSTEQQRTKYEVQLAALTGTSA